MKEGNNVMTMYYSALYTLSNSNYGRIYQDKPFIEISDECREIAEIIEPQKLDRIEIPANYILSLEDDIHEENSIQRIDLPRFRGNSLIGNSTSRRSFQRIREEVHSPFLIKGNYYNGEREVEETKILIDTGASCNHIQADKCEMIGTITSPYVYKNYDGQTLECNLKVEIPIRLQGITFLVDCYKDNRMQGNGHYDILLGNNFLDRLDNYKITKEGIEIHNEDMYFSRKTKMKEITFPTMVFIIVKILETKLYTCGLIDTGSEITIFKSFLLKEWENTKISIKGVTGEKEKITKQKENVEIMIPNKIVKIGKVYQYNNIECDIILGNDFLQQFSIYQ